MFEELYLWIKRKHYVKVAYMCFSVLKLTLNGQHWSLDVIDTKVIITKYIGAQRGRIFYSGMVSGRNGCCRIIVYFF